MAESFGIRDRYEPKEIYHPQTSEKDFQRDRAHYTSLEGKIVGCLEGFQGGASFEDIASQLQGTSTEVLVITQGHIEFVLDEYLLGSKVRSEGSGQNVRYFLNKTN